MKYTFVCLCFALLSAQSAWAERTLKAGDGRLAPEFVLPGVDGAEHSLHGYRGKFVLMNFWAVWCAPCRKEMPSMQRLYEQRKGGRFELLAVHVGPSAAQARAFAEQHGLSFPVLVDENLDMAAWKLRGLPTSFLLDPNGRIIAKASGERTWDSPAMLSALDAYMSSEPGADGVALQDVFAGSISPKSAHYSRFSASEDHIQPW